MKCLRPAFFAAILVLLPFQARSADTTSVSLERAESMFLKNNLQLLAAKFNIDAANAAIVQARLWNNPNLAVEQNLYNQYTKRFFDITSSGNTEIQIQQLFQLAGKRDKEIHLAEINKNIAEDAFYNLLRSLRYELRTDFFDLVFLDRSLGFYNESIASIRRTVAATMMAYTKGGIVLSEVLRLKSLLFSLEKERLDLSTQIDVKERDLHVLLNDSTFKGAFIIPLVDSAKLEAFHPGILQEDDLVTMAMTSRPDYRLAEATVSYDETNLGLQRALSVPDLTIGGIWSRAGSYIPNYYALTVSVDLPVFNRNQGNIETSQKTLEADKRSAESAREGIRKDVMTAYAKAVKTDSTYLLFDREFAGQYRQLVNGMIANYERRNISIIEFTDFFESYRTSMVEMEQLRSDRVEAFENLNYATGSNLFNPY